ncbi:MAG: ATP-binding protein [Alphaproteobacteria bacterium]
MTKDILDQSTVHEALNAKLDRVSANHSILLIDPVSNDNVRQVELLLASAMSDPDIVHIAVIDDRGNDVARLGRANAGTGTIIAERPLRVSDLSGITNVGTLIVEMTDVHRITEARRLLVITTGFGIVLLTILLGVSFVIHRRFVGRPIREMIDVIERTERGVGDARVAWKSHDDIGAVAAAFNNMRDRQEAFEHALEEAHTNLERRVQQRTKDLAEARDAAEAANLAKSGFLASMSHELRTPLNAIIGFSQLLEMPHLEEKPEKRREYLRDILNSSEHLLSLINDLLDLSKIEAGRSELFETKVVVSDLLEAVTDMIRPLAQSAGITVNLTHHRENLLVMADAQKIRQIMLNLLSNAIKFTPRGGSIFVSVTRNRNRGLNLAIADTGIGIAPEDMERVLEPFEQVAGQRAANPSGTGLGLPLTLGLVELHGGTLKLMSKPGNGTREPRAQRPRITGLGFAGARSRRASRNATSKAEAFLDRSG